MDKNFYDITIQDLVDMGASVVIRFHHEKNKQQALDQVESLNMIGKPKEESRNGYKWVAKESDGVEITAFYEEDGE